MQLSRVHADRKDDRPKALMVLKMKSWPTVLQSENTTRWMCIAGWVTTKSTADSSSCVCTKRDQGEDHAERVHHEHHVIRADVGVLVKQSRLVLARK